MLKRPLNQHKGCRYVDLCLHGRARRKILSQFYVLSTGVQTRVEWF